MRIPATALFVILTSNAAVADPGDGEKAKDMLARVAVAVQQDQNLAIRKFNAGSDGFRDGNMYPFCFRLSDGVVITGQTAGSDIRSFPGSGQQIFEATQKSEDAVTEIGCSNNKLGGSQDCTDRHRLPGLRFSRDPKAKLFASPLAP